MLEQLGGRPLVVDRPQAELVPPTLWDWPASLPPSTQARLRQGPGAHFRLTMPEESFGLNCRALLVLARSPRLAEPTHRAHELHRTTSPVRDRWSVRCRLSRDVPWPERCPESTCRSAASPFVMPTGCTTPFPSHSQSPSLAGSTGAHSVAWVGGLPGFCAAARPPWPTGLPTAVSPPGLSSYLQELSLGEWLLPIHAEPSPTSSPVQTILRTLEHCVWVP